MAKKNNSGPENHETDLDLLVKIELVSINEKPFFGQATDDELLYIWVTVFKRKFEELYGVSSSKSLTRNVRATYKLKKPMKLHEIEGPNFTYTKYLDDGNIETINGRILGYGAVRPAELGELVKITVKTNLAVEASGVVTWLKLFGTLTTQHDFVTNPKTGLKTDVFEGSIVLRKHVPEFLPMYGQKCQVNYAGIPKQCNRCYLSGHLRRECNNKKRDWIEYVNGLVEELRIGTDLIGTWRNAVERWKNANSLPETSQKPKE